MARWGALGGAVGMMAMTGCASVLEALPSAGPVYRPKNIYRGGEKLPRDVKRVAVLPLRIDGKDFATEQARPGLEKALLGEMAKAERFELVRVKPEQLRDWSGKLAWGVEEELPEGVRLVDGWHIPEEQADAYIRERERFAKLALHFYVWRRASGCREFKGSEV